jgi:hypothetical protein
MTTDSKEHRPEGLRLRVVEGTEVQSRRTHPRVQTCGTRSLNRPQHFQTPYPFIWFDRLPMGFDCLSSSSSTPLPESARRRFLKEIEYAVLTNPDVKEKGYGIGFLHLEELGQ